MTALIIQFPSTSLAKLPRTDVVEGEIVSDVPLGTIPGCALTSPLANRVAHLPWKAPKRPGARAKRIVAEPPPAAPPTGFDMPLPTENRFVHVEQPKKPKRRAKMRVEQVEVTCTRVPRKHQHDLRTLAGVLTIDWKGETPWTATFDPDDESIPNLVAPIEGFARTADEILVTTDEGTWTFALLTDDSDDEED